MNSFTKFFHELISPHCQHCIDERREAKICAACEVSQLQIARLQFENEKLLNRLFEKPVEEPKADTTELKPIMPKMPWRVKQQMLESESRHQAKLMKQAASITTNDLEAEMGIVEQEKEG